MHPALWISKTGLDAQSTNISITSHNLANVENNGFKRQRGIFVDLFYQKIRQPGAETGPDNELPSGLMLGKGVRLAATTRDFTQGNPVRTDNSTDIAIDGRGFFQVLQLDGTTAYTRNGHFELDKNGNLVTSEGLQLQPNIVVPAQSTSFSVSPDGIVSVSQPGTTQPTQIGQLNLADFINYPGLEPIGDDLYLASGASGDPQINNPNSNGYGKLLSGNLEASNVNVVEELVNLIQDQRAYEMNAKAIETVDQMLQFTSQTL